MPSIRHPIDADCFACYRCDEAGPTDSLLDSGPNNMPLAYDVDGPCPSVPSLFGTARTFYCPGNGNYLRRFFNNDASNMPHTDVQRLTISAWVTRGINHLYGYDTQWIDLAPIFGRVFISNGYGVNYYSYALTLMNDGIPRFFLWLDGVGSYVIVESPAALLDEETLVTAVWDGTYAILYVGGVEVARSANHAGRSILYNTWTAEGWLRSASPGWASMSHAAFDDIALYNVAKSQGWIAGINDAPERSCADTIAISDDVSVDLIKGIAVSEPVISQGGGTLLTLTAPMAVFTIGTPYQVHMGPLGTSDDPLCYGGEGYGYSCYSWDGVTIQVVTPPVASGSEGHQFFSVVVDSGETVREIQVGSVTVVEAPHYGKIESVRQGHPPWAGVGSRRLELEPRRRLV